MFLFVTVFNIRDIMGIMMGSLAKDAYPLLSLYATNRTFRQAILKFILTDTTALSFINNAVHTGHYAAWVFLLRDVGHLVSEFGLYSAALLAQERGLHGFVCAYVRYGGYDSCERLFYNAALWANDIRPLRAMLRDGYARRMSAETKNKFLHALVHHYPPIDRFILLENAGFDLTVKSLPDTSGRDRGGNNLLRAMVKYVGKHDNEEYHSSMVQLAVYFVKDKGMDPAEQGPRGGKSVFELAATKDLWRLVKAMRFAGGDYEKVRFNVEGTLRMKYASDSGMCVRMMTVGSGEGVIQFDL